MQNLEKTDIPPQAETLSDEVLVKEILDGGMALFEVLIRRHNQRVYRSVRAILKDEDEVEDVMQQAYLAAYQNLAQFHGGARFRTWLIRIAIHEALARLRKRGRFVALGDDPEGREMKADRPETPSPEEQAIRRELLAALERAVDGLKEHYRVVFILRDVEGMSTAEAAECLGLSEELIKQRLHRARVLLRDALYDRIGRSAAEAFAFHAPRCDRVVHAVLEKLAQGASSSE